LLPKNVWGNLDVKKLNLEAFALSLGLASVPNLDFLKEVKNREGLRDTKNVNRKLQKLKEQIRLEKEKKKKKKEESKKRKPSDHEEDSEDDLLVVKARHEYSQDNTNEGDELRSGSDRHPKKIRIDGSNSQKSHHTKFNEDGTVQPKMLQAAESDSDESLDKEAVEEANDSYMEQVLQRLEQTRDIDKKDERERIRAKHKKQRLQDRAERASPDEEGENSNDRFTLSTDDADSSSSSSSDESASSDSDSESSSSSEDEDMDVTVQEDIALSLIRGNA